VPRPQYRGPLLLPYQEERKRREADELAQQLTGGQARLNPADPDARNKFNAFLRDSVIEYENEQLVGRIQSLGQEVPPLPPESTPEERNFYLRRFVGAYDPEERVRARESFTRILTEPFAAPAATAASQLAAATGLGPESFRQALAEEAESPGAPMIGGDVRRAFERTRGDWTQIATTPLRALMDPGAVALEAATGRELFPLRRVGTAELLEAAVDPYNLAAAGPAARGVGQLARRGAPIVARAGREVAEELAESAVRGGRRLAGEVVPEPAAAARAQAGGIRPPTGEGGRLATPVETLPSPSVAEATSNVIGLRRIVPQLTRTERMANLVRKTIGQPFEAILDEPRATAAMNEMNRVRQVADSVSSDLSARTGAMVREAFDLDEVDRIPSLAGVDPGIPGAPTVQDVAARLPRYLDNLTPAQRQVMTDLQTDVGQFRTMMEGVGVEVPTRPDIVEGGFYLPRGGADPSGLSYDLPRVPSRQRRGGGAGFMKPATFDSMAEGIEQGFEYGPIEQAIAGYASGASRNSIDAHVANYFKALRNESGALVGTTPKTRLMQRDPQIREKVMGLRQTLARLQASGARLSDRQYRAVQRFVHDPLFDDIDELAVALGQPIEQWTPKGHPAFARTAGGRRLLEQTERLPQRIQRGRWAKASAQDVRRLTREVNIRLKALMPAWKTAQRRARSLARGEGAIDLPRMQSWGFPDEVANAANKVLQDMTPYQRGRYGPVTRTAEAFNNLYRGMRATLDNSALGIQGLLGLADDPRAYGNALRVNVQAWGNGGDRALGKFLVNFNREVLQGADRRLTSQEWARHGLRVGGAETEFMLGRGPLAGLGRLPLVRQANRAFGYFGDALRLEWADDMLQGELRRDRPLAELVASGDVERIATVTNNMTGWARGRAGGAWGEILMFAPRFFQSRLETVGRAMMSARLGATIEQRAARRSLLKLIGGGVLLTVAMNEALGNETDFRPVVNGRRNSNFLRIRFGGRDWSLFGTWDSLLGAFIETAMGRPERAFRGMSSGLVGVTWDTLSGTDFLGRPVRDTPEDFGRYVMEEVSPFAMQEIPSAIEEIREGNVPGGTATILGEMVGAKSAPLSRIDRLDVATQQATNGAVMKYDDLDYNRQRILLDTLPEEVVADMHARDEELMRAGNPFAKNRIEQRELDESRVLREAEALLMVFGTTAEENPWLFDSKGRKRSSVSLFQQFWRYGSGDNYSEIQDSVRDRKFQARKSNLRGMPEFEQERPADDEPLAQALSDYWAINDKATTEAGNYRADIWAQEYEKLQAVWTDEQKAYIEEYRSLREHAPGIAEMMELANIQSSRTPEQLNRQQMASRLNDIWRQYHTQWEQILAGQGVEPTTAEPQPVQPTPTPTPAPVWFSPRRRSEGAGVR